jgi:hypothetical protein
MTAPLTIAARVADGVAYTPYLLPIALIALVAWVVYPSRQTATRAAAARDIAAAADIPADADRDVLQQLEEWYRLPDATERNTRTEDPR